MQTMLQLGGYQVESINDGTTLVGTTVEFRPHIVFLDLAMPGPNEYDLAKQVAGRLMHRWQM
jgi:CheY-like chemotaxis protein